MSTVTDPILLDRTGQDIVVKLQRIADAIIGGTIVPLTVTANGIYIPDGQTAGYGPITVDVAGDIRGNFSVYYTNKLYDDSPVVGELVE